MKTYLSKLWLIAALSLCAIPAMALDWTCSIDTVGPQQDGTVWIQLTETGGAPEFTDRWFKMQGSTVAVNRMLAIAISGMSNGMDVIITANSSTAGSSITYIGLVR